MHVLHITCYTGYWLCIGLGLGELDMVTKIHMACNVSGFEWRLDLVYRRRILREDYSMSGSSAPCLFASTGGWVLFGVGENAGFARLSWDHQPHHLQSELEGPGPTSALITQAWWLPTTWKTRTNIGIVLDCWANRTMAVTKFLKFDATHHYRLIRSRELRSTP
jgi:hypothetical protein